MNGECRDVLPATTAVDLEGTSSDTQSISKPTMDAPLMRAIASFRTDFEEYKKHNKENDQKALYASSKYNEKVFQYENLSLYEVYGEPWLPSESSFKSNSTAMNLSATIETQKTFPVDFLNTQFTCPICYGILKKTCVVVKCLHRFCNDCIMKSLANCRKECPACRAHLPSKRSTRRDENFDAIIQVIYPNLDQFEQEYDEQVARSIRDELSTMKSTSPIPSQSQSSSGAASNNKKRKMHEDKELSLPLAQKLIPISRESIMDFLLQRHPGEETLDELQRSSLRTSNQLQVKHMKRFLGKKLKQGQGDELEIMVIEMEGMSNGKGFVLTNDWSLEDIQRNYFQSKNGQHDLEVILYYRRKPRER